jgi:cytochrome c biogenesis protein
MSNVEIPELGFTALLRFAWRQLTSMRTALILLMMLGIGAIPGSLIPQRTTNPMAVQDFFSKNPDLAKWYERFSLFDVYASPWFSAIYILLFISLIGCVLPRSVEHFHAMRALPPATPRNLNRLEFFHEMQFEGDALEPAAQWLTKNRFRVRREEGNLSAEKGYLRETGNLFFHLSLILILVGVLMCRDTGFKSVSREKGCFFFHNSAFEWFSIELHRIYLIEAKAYQTHFIRLKTVM